MTSAVLLWSRSSVWGLTWGISTLILLTLGRPRQEALEFEVSLGHITSYILHSPTLKKCLA